ncbi:hypothetical protein BC936DRAFT_138280 [Jimgerdemannia flammicorona]|uniref:peptidylprolyl isomerase n=1 Tax=Jimgerdemannia flammicorona TaxID=994334 RepID=A0A433CTR1_9FUNG|nr:hypothetical protein BC936DRAFT_138280 [Jimgerdemannia flammicorona]
MSLFHDTTPHHTNMSDNNPNMTDSNPNTSDDANTSGELFQPLTPDGGLKKRILKEGHGPLPPKGANLKVHYVGTLHSDNTPFDSSRDRKVPFTFDLGSGQVIKGWEEGVKTMKVGELAELICSPDYAYGQSGKPPLIPKNSTLKFEIELLDFTQKSGQTPAEKLREATKNKEKGNEEFKKAEYRSAIFFYKQANDCLTDMWDCLPAEMDQSRALTIAIGTNMAACHLKLEEYELASKACLEVLERDPKNVKAVYRLSQAYLHLREYERGIVEVGKGLKVP